MICETNSLNHSAASIRNRLQDARGRTGIDCRITAMMAERMQQLDADMGRMQRELAANEDEQKHLLDVITASKASTERRLPAVQHYYSRITDRCRQ